MPTTSIPLPTAPAPEPPPIPLTVTHVLEHLYCPRFTYFEYVLGVPERQERRALVQKGRQSHQERRQPADDTLWVLLGNGSGNQLAEDQHHIG